MDIGQKNRANQVTGPDATKKGVLPSIVPILDPLQSSVSWPPQSQQMSPAALGYHGIPSAPYPGQHMLPQQTPSLPQQTSSLPQQQAPSESHPSNYLLASDRLHEVIDNADTAFQAPKPQTDAWPSDPLPHQLSKAPMPVILSGYHPNAATSSVQDPSTFHTSSSVTAQHAYSSFVPPLPHHDVPNPSWPSPQPGFYRPWNQTVTFGNQVKRRRSSGMIYNGTVHHQRSTTVPTEYRPSILPETGTIPTVSTEVGTYSTPVMSNPGVSNVLYELPPFGSPSAGQRPSTPMLRFKVVLQAPTAATQMSEGSPTTYLNRGQTYSIHLQDTQGLNTCLKSTFAIMFHEPAHRKVAINYWKFWLSQQKDPQHARAVTLDQEQSVGIHNVHYPGFDRIAFEWNGQVGAKVFVRFNCLSTDFSRIKGVKGIPLRAYMETKADTSHVQQTMTTFYRQTRQDAAYVEQCYCKVKLFRDKGAERKNKDDAKQINKHLERVSEGNPNLHHLWLMYNQPQPVSVLNEIPMSPMPCFARLPDLLREQQHTLSSDEDNVIPACTDRGTQPSSVSPIAQEASLICLSEKHPADPTPQHGQLQPLASEVVGDSAHHHPKASDMVLLKRSFSEFSPLPSGTGSDLILYVDVKTTQHQRFQRTTSPIVSKTHTRIQPIVLNQLTVDDLTAKLCPLLSLHHSQVTEVLWRRPSSIPKDDGTLGATRTAEGSDRGGKEAADSQLVVMDDASFARQFIKGGTVYVEWEIKVDGTVRLVLQ